jgi:hypothetical protein
MKEIFKLAKEKGYKGENSLFLIQEWVLEEHNLFIEIFFSMFHKKWSINNYALDTKKRKKINISATSTFYNDYKETLGKALLILLNLKNEKEKS